MLITYPGRACPGPACPGHPYHTKQETPVQVKPVHTHVSHAKPWNAIQAKPVQTNANHFMGVSSVPLRVGIQ